MAAQLYYNSPPILDNLQLEMYYILVVKNIIFANFRFNFCLIFVFNILFLVDSSEKIRFIKISRA